MGNSLDPNAGILRKVLDARERQRSLMNGRDDFDNPETTLRALSDALLVFPDEHSGEDAKFEMNQGVDLIVACTALLPSNTAHLIYTGVIRLLEGAASAQIDVLMKLIQDEQNRSAPLIKINNEKDKSKERAKEIAKEKWSDDTDKKIRSGEMADLVFEQLKQEGCTNLPENSKALKEWISDVKPPYASCSGRSKAPKTKK